MPSEASSRRRGRGRGSPADPQPTQRRGRGSAARRRRADDRLRAGYSRVVHFDVPGAGGREIISVDWRGERPESGRVPAGGPTVLVALGRDGRYSTHGLPGRFDTIDELLHAFGACWPSPCAVPPTSEEQSSTAAQAGSYPLYAPTSSRHAQSSTAAQAGSYALYASTSTQHAQSSTAVQAGSYPLYASTSTQQAQSSTAAQAGSYPLYASTSTQHAQSSTAVQTGSYPLYASTSTQQAQSSTAAQASTSATQDWSYAPTSATQNWPYAPVFTPSSAPVFAPTSEHAPPPTPYAHFSKMFAKYLPKCPPAYSSYSPTPSKEQHMDEPASAHTLQKLDVLSLEDSNNGPPGCPLSSSPIWNRSVFDWGITFYTTRDLTGSFHTYPDVGGPFQSLDEVNSAIDRYLIDNQDPTMCEGLSQVDAIVKRVRYYPDGTKKRGSEVKDKRRDGDYQLARALVDMYNDHHNLFGDLAYEVKDFLHGEPLWEDYYIHWTYFHMNFTAKTKGSYGVDTGNLFFAEVKYNRGDDGLTVNSCCILEPSSDHGLCYGCGADMKHPNDGNAYACGQRNISYRFQNGAPELPPGYCADRYYEDSDEEVERLRSQFKEDVKEELKPLPMPLVV